MVFFSIVPSSKRHKLPIKHHNSKKAVEKKKKSWIELTSYILITGNWLFKASVSHPVHLILSQKLQKENQISSFSTYSLPLSFKTSSTNRNLNNCRQNFCSYVEYTGTVKDWMQHVTCKLRCLIHSSHCIECFRKNGFHTFKCKFTVGFKLCYELNREWETNVMGFDLDIHSAI